MRASVLLVGLIAACAGSATPPVVPEATNETAINTTTLPPPPANCPSKQQLCKAPSPASSRPWPIPSGFWCAKSRKTANSAALNVCYSTEITCNTLRKQGLKSGALVSTCRTRDSAHCFTMVQPTEQSVYWRCYESTGECSTMRQKWSSEQPKLFFGECALTNPSQISTKHQAVTQRVLANPPAQPQSTQRTAARTSAE